VLVKTSDDFLERVGPDFATGHNECVCFLPRFARAEMRQSDWRHHPSCLSRFSLLILHSVSKQQLFEDFANIGMEIGVPVRL
jgi:hypothetical protein